MKKILGAIICSFIIFTGGFVGTPLVFSAGCEYSEANSDIAGQLAGCLDKTPVVKANNVALEGEFKVKVNSWTNNIALILGIMAVGSIVLGGLMMTLSMGDDEKVKKAKDIVKWGILGFLAIIMASSVIKLVVNIMYSV